MNAYELADELAECIIDGSTDLVCVAQAANMLRQQADRIAELEKQGKPVAWMNGNEICPEIGYEATITTKHPKDLGWIPLYTHPVKELTDELFDKIFADGKRLGVLETEDRFYKAMQLSDEEIKQIWYNLYPLSSSSYWDDKREGLAELKFARAILRKAQEK